MKLSLVTSIDAQDSWFAAETQNQSVLWIHLGGPHSQINQGSNLESRPGVCVHVCYRSMQ